MSILTEAQAKAILDKVIALSTADECTASLTGSVDGNIRFALNNVSTSGIVSNTDLAVQVAFGKRAVCTAQHRSYDRVVATCRIGGVSIGDLMRGAGIQEGGNGR